MLTLSNLLSLLRAPLAFLFLVDIPVVRALVIFSAMLTDVIDGYLARKYKFTTKLGAVLDPLMDKFFVFFVLGVFFYEHTLVGWQVVAMLSRDISLLIFTGYLFSINKWRQYQPKAVLSGKITTAMQFASLFFLSLNIYVSWYFYPLFIFFSFLVLIELFFTLKTNLEKI